MAQTQAQQPHKSSIGGIDANLMVLIAYLGSAVLAFIPIVQYVAFLLPLVLFFLEKESPFVRFHAMQSFILYICCDVLMIVLSIISTIALAGLSLASLGVVSVLGILILVVQILYAVLCVLAVLKAWKYETFRIPLVGDWADNFAAKLGK